jgi:hypothetical protein
MVMAVDVDFNVGATGCACSRSPRIQGGNAEFLYVLTKDVRPDGGAVAREAGRAGRGWRRNIEGIRHFPHRDCQLEAWGAFRRPRRAQFKIRTTVLR